MLQMVNINVQHYFYRPQTNSAKVMFLHLSVSHSVHRRGAIPACITGDIPACLAAGLRGGSPCPHPMGKLRGIWSRPTAKGEVEGDLVEAHSQGEVEGDLARGCLLWGVSAPGVCLRGSAGGEVPALGGVCSRGLLAGVCSGGGTCSGGCLLQGGLLHGGCVETLPSRDGYCCGRYASYWNAFLLRQMYWLFKYASKYISQGSPL